jgi:hypothetical protein
LGQKKERQGLATIFSLSEKIFRKSILAERIIAIETQFDSTLKIGQ